MGPPRANPELDHLDNWLSVCQKSYFYPDCIWAMLLIDNLFSSMCKRSKWKMTSFSRNCLFIESVPDWSPSSRCLNRLIKKSSWCLEQRSEVNLPIPRQTKPVNTVDSVDKCSCRVSMKDRKYSDLENSWLDCWISLKSSTLYLDNSERDF